MPDNIAAVPAPQAPVYPSHAEYKGHDAIDDQVVAEEKKRKRILAEQEVRAMRGLVTAHFCTQCNRRLNAVPGGGVGVCPYCKQATIPAARTAYTGGSVDRSVRDPVKLDSFRQGVNSTGYMTRAAVRREA